MLSSKCYQCSLTTSGGSLTSITSTKKAIKQPIIFDVETLNLVPQVRALVELAIV